MKRIVLSTIGLGLLFFGCFEKSNLTLPTSCTIEGRCEFKPTVQDDCDCAGIDLHFLSVEDSRCPQGVECLWEGRVTVKFLANGVDTVGFSLPGDLSNFNARVDTLGDKALRLIGLFPYPQQDQIIKREDYFIVTQWEEL
jgi:hypothetical protein